MKLRTVIAYYITSITKQLNILNSHCSIVCSYCSVVCLICKKWAKKTIEFSSPSQENEIHKVNSPFNEDCKNVIFSRDGQLENFVKMGNNRDIYCYANWESSISKENISLYPWYQNPCDALTFLNARTNFREKMKKLNFQAKI